MGEITKQELDKTLREDIVYNSDKVASSADIKIHGRTLVNLLGRAGNPIYRQRWIPRNSNTVELEDSNYVDNKINITQAYENVYSIGQLIINDVKPEECFLYMANFSESIDSVKGLYKPICHHNALVTSSRKEKFDWENGIGLVAFKIGDSQTNPNNRLLHVGTTYSKDNVSDGTICDLKLWNLRLYKITEEQFNNIDVEKIVELDKQYPYVDDVKCVVNPYLESRENLLDGYLPYIGTFTENAQFLEDSNAISIITNTFIEENETLSISIEGEYANDFIASVFICNGEYEFLHYGKNYTQPTLNFKNAGRICLHIHNSNFTNGLTIDLLLKSMLSNKTRVVLVRGSEPKSFEDCHNSRIMFETKLYDGETISRRNDGTYVKNSEWDELSVLDFMNNDMRIRRRSEEITVIDFKVNDIGKTYHSEDKQYYDKFIMYDGSILKHLDVQDWVDNDKEYIESASWHWGGDASVVIKTLTLSLPNNLTGWGPTYTPTEEEVKAFFLGWKMYDSLQGSNDGKFVNYNRTDGQNKAWAKLWCGIGKKYVGDTYEGLLNCIHGSYVTVCPTVMNNQGFTPCRLVYQKETPAIEEVKTHGSLLVKEGVELNVDSGLVLEEFKSTLYTSDSVSYINPMSDTTNYYGASGANNRAYRILRCLNMDSNSEEIVKCADTTNMEHMIIYGIGYAKLDSVTNPVKYDYLIYRPDTVTSFDYSITKADNVEQLISRSHQDVVNCFEELARTKRELERANELLRTRSNPNLLTNGNFDIWQRGESISLDEGIKYCADRWCAYYSDRYNTLFEKTNDGFFKATVTNVDPSTGKYKIVEIGQLLTEDVVKTFRGKTVTASIKYRDIKTQNPSQIKFFVAFSSNKSDNTTPGATLNRISKNESALDVTNSSMYQTFTFTVPENTNVMSFRFGIAPLKADVDDLVAGDTMTVEYVKLEVGEQATPPVAKSYSEELRECQRFLQKINPYTDFFTGRTNYDNTTARLSIPVVSKMRGIPTLILPTGSGIAVFGTGNGWTKIYENISIPLDKMSDTCLLTGEIALEELSSPYSVLTGYFTTISSDGIFLDAEIY